VWVSSIHIVVISRVMIRSSDPSPYPLLQLFFILCIGFLNPIRYPFWLLPYSYTPLCRTSLYLLYTLYTAYILLIVRIRYSFEVILFYLSFYLYPYGYCLCTYPLYTYLLYILSLFLLLLLSSVLWFGLSAFVTGL